MERAYDLQEVLAHLDPAALNYQEWLSVGMALKDAGYPLTVWDDWSRRDLPRYHAGECARKWSGFHGSASPVTGGTIVQLAREQGWRPASRADDAGYELDWSSSIGRRDDLVIVDTDWIENREITEPTEWDPAAQLVKYLETLFDASDTVGYVTRSYEKDGRYLPERGCYDRTAGEIIKQLNRCKGDMGIALGDYNPEAGAWIRFNPLDGKGVKNDNVTEYRYALVESDTTDVERQYAILHDLDLPIACLVHSGGKSLHAIVRIDAANYEEYRKRVDYLYSVCKRNGLAIDSQNRNPSRLSRMPGVMRNGRKQFLIDVNLGKSSYEEWREWIESVNDDLPEPESMADVWAYLPDLSPPLIDGVLRQGHKMLLAGPSKAGKSYALIELSCAIAEGRTWLGWSCAQGRVLYVNLELDRASCLHRFRDVYDALGWAPENLRNIDIWNLRGKSIPMDQLAPKLIRRAVKKHYIAVIIDPIYKVITGDENSADQMAHFCNQFDKVCTNLGCAVIYCHHHSKGVQGGKRSMDRASGSGVFARDPDALLDMIELDLPDALMQQERSKAVCQACSAALSRFRDDWEDTVSQDAQCSEAAMRRACEQILPPSEQRRLLGDIQAAKEAANRRTAWRIDGTLREFPKFAPVNIWFDYPVHRLDRIGSLLDVQTDMPQTSGKEGYRSKQKTPAERQAGKQKALDDAYAALSVNGEVTLADLMGYLGKSKNTVRDYVDSSGKYTRDGGIIRPL